MKKVTVGLILWKTKYLEKTIPSLLAQDYENIEFVFRDQEEGVHSAYAYLEREMPWVFERARVTREPNLFHGGGHNEMIAGSDAEYYIAASNDMLYPGDFVSKMVEAMEGAPDAGFAGCKLLRWDFEGGVKTDRIDSMGIGITPRHQYYEIGYRRRDRGQFDDIENVFGVSAALVLFRRSALEAVKQNDEYFDKHLHYKNDVDLCYRLQYAGFSPIIVSDVKVYHDRQAAKYKFKEPWIIRSTYRGDKAILLKDYSRRYPWWIRWQTLSYAFMKDLYLHIFYPSIGSEKQFIRKHRSEFVSKGAEIPKAQSRRIVDLMKQDY